MSRLVKVSLFSGPWCTSQRVSCLAWLSPRVTHQNHLHTHLTVFSCGTLRQWCRKFLSRNFYMFWPPYGWKFWFGTFDPKMGKKSYREILCTTGAEFRSAVVALRTAECQPGTSDQMDKIWKFWPGESIFLWNFAPMVPKVSLQDFYTFWSPYGQKFWFSTFDWGPTISLSKYFWSMVRLMAVKRPEQNSLTVFYSDALLSSTISFFAMVS